MFKDKKIIFANIFYLLFFMADSFVTSTGISTGSSVEGDPVVIWLWSIFGQDSLLLKLIYIAIIFSVSFILYKKLSKFLGLLIPFSFGAGHMLGFTTWIFRYNNEFNSNLIFQLHAFLVPYGLFILAPILGLIITFFVRKI